MSDNYSIDDILAEIDRKRGGGSKSTESVTEIISETELHSAMNSTPDTMDTMHISVNFSFAPC